MTLQRFFISNTVNAVLSNFIFNFIFIWKKYLGFHKTIKQLNIANNNKDSWAPNQHIRMISEGSCDTAGIVASENSSQKWIIL